MSTEPNTDPIRAAATAAGSLGCRSVFYVSDGTAITAETVGHAVLTQFEHLSVRQVTVPFVDSVERARGVADAIVTAARDDGVRPIVFTSLVRPEVLDAVMASGALVLDLFNMFARPLEEELNIRSTYTSGRSHALVDKATYDVRMDAVNFALHHDDGASIRQYDKAQVILVGVSRSGKTPTSLYLAMQFGIQAANYPLTDDDLDGNALPKLLRPYRERLFGLTIDPTQLAQIRAERRPNSRYASLSQCRHEVEEAERLLRRSNVPYLDTTAISIEEISSKVIEAMGLVRRLF